jgi:hypothetical protein
MAGHDTSNAVLMTTIFVFVCVVLHTALLCFIANARRVKTQPWMRFGCVFGQFTLLSMTSTFLIAIYGNKLDYVLSDISTRVCLQLLIVCGAQLMIACTSSFCVNDCCYQLRMLPNSQWNQSLQVMESNMFRRVHYIHGATVFSMCIAMLASNLELFLVILQCTSTYVMCWLTYVNWQCLVVLKLAASDLSNACCAERLNALQRTCRLGLACCATFTLLLIIYIPLVLVHGNCMGPVIHVTAAPFSGLTPQCITVAVSAFSWSLVFVAAYRLANGTATAMTHVHPGPKRISTSSRRQAFTDGPRNSNKSQVCSSHRNT